ncbi:hypothetical protein NDU88_005365 [Pleurodeles waltl]|uniref:Uncharacterized protein n=1 Tax=Pleurodeles waltl TaxID=8319 RepID=A0AAV7SLH2_PLEWA|nr:hypothetical protein NDU88_005365 [Pleurodeles waltl]
MLSMEDGRQAASWPPNSLNRLLEQQISDFRATGAVALRQKGGAKESRGWAGLMGSSKKPPWHRSGTVRLTGSWQPPGCSEPGSWLLFQTGMGCRPAAPSGKPAISHPTISDTTPATWLSTAHSVAVAVAVSQRLHGALHCQTAMNYYKPE